MSEAIRLDELPEEIVCIIFDKLGDFTGLRATSKKYARIGAERFERFKTEYFAKCINCSNRDLATSVRYKQYVIGYRLDSDEKLDIFDWADMFESVTSHYSFDALFLIYKFDLSEFANDDIRNHRVNMQKYISEIIKKLTTPQNQRFFSLHFSSY